MAQLAYLKDTIARARITLRGIVQGVGMRPYIYKLAQKMSLRGYVLNSGSGVIIEVEGERIEDFIDRLTKSPPPLAKISDVEIKLLPILGYEDFSIRESKEGLLDTILPPDVSTCRDCLNEILEPKDRRYKYPFTNCTNCGPRYSISMGIPYDRRNTTMRVFKMCPECEKEYKEPSNRRFHAQPNACPVCGPRLELLIGTRRLIDGALEGAVKLLREGKILAIKGIGGFHLACDAKNDEAVRTLRERKNRPKKPFAVMVKDIETLRGFCYLDNVEEALLCSIQSPIVLLRARRGGFLSKYIAPGLRRYGVMLPYTPLHHLLFHEGGFDALVMTSGNLSDEPISIGNEEAIRRLGSLADAFLLNDRDIHMRTDDSVVFVFEGRGRFIRRSRGYVPMAIRLALDSPDVVAVGGELKNTFTLIKGNDAIVSPHIGDMKNKETLEFFEETLNNMKSIYGVSPKIIAHDLHPDYMTTIWAERTPLKKVALQHHYAHILSCMAEHSLIETLIGVALDGLGYGTDGAVWGGEFMIADCRGFKRAGHLRYLPLPGGDMAVKEPWRMAISYIYDTYGSDTEDILRGLGFYERIPKKNIDYVIEMIKKNLNSPSTSSAGRLFDAVSSILGLCDRASFEAEPAMLLEAISEEDIKDSYPVDIKASTGLEIDLSPAIIAIVRDIQRGIPKGVIASRFHNTISEAVLRVVLRLSYINRIDKVALSGGVFQNIFLLKRLFNSLRGAGLKVFINEKVPTNDGGLSLGQAFYIAMGTRDER